MKTVLLIDDDEDYRESIRSVLQEEGVEVLDAECPDDAFSLLEKSSKPDLIVCDLHMPFTRGEKEKEFVNTFEVGARTAQELQWVYPDIPVVALTSLPKFEIEARREALRPIPTFTKPAKMADLVELIATILVSTDYGGVN